MVLIETRKEIEATDGTTSSTTSIDFLIRNFALPTFRALETNTQ